MQDHQQTPASRQSFAITPRQPSQQTQGPVRALFENTHVAPTFAGQSPLSRRGSKPHERLQQSQSLSEPPALRVLPTLRPLVPARPRAAERLARPAPVRSNNAPTAARARQPAFASFAPLESHASSHVQTHKFGSTRVTQPGQSWFLSGR